MCALMTTRRLLLSLSPLTFRLIKEILICRLGRLLWKSRRRIACRVGLSLSNRTHSLRDKAISQFQFSALDSRELSRANALIRNSFLLPHHQAAYSDPTSSSSLPTEKPQYYISLSRHKNSAPGKCLFFIFFNANLYVALISRRFSFHSSFLHFNDFFRFYDTSSCCFYIFTRAGST